MKNEKLPWGIRIVDGAYVVHLTHPDGTHERRSAGRVGVVTEKWAIGQREIWLREIQTCTYERRKPRVKPAKEVTCADLWDTYLADCETRQIKRVDRARLAWSHLEPVFGSKAARSVRPRDIAEYVASRRAAGMSAGTCNREVAILKAALRLAARLEMIEHCPVFPKKLREAKPRQGFIEQEQYTKLAAASNELWLRTFLALGFNFGCRKSEMLGLRVKDVDLLNGWLNISDSKNGDARPIKLTPETKTLLAECVRNKQPHDPVLSRQDGSAVAQPRKDWYSLCARCGLGRLTETGTGRKKRQRYEGLQMHDLRRSGVRRMIRLGVHEKTAMAISGHKTPSVFYRYNIINERDLEKAAQLLNAGGQAEFDSKIDSAVSADQGNSRKSLN